MGLTSLPLTVLLGESAAYGEGGVDEFPEWVGVVGLVEASHVACGGLGCDHAELFEYLHLAGQVAGVGSAVRYSSHVP